MPHPVTEESNHCPNEQSLQERRSLENKDSHLSLPASFSPSTVAIGQTGLETEHKRSVVIQSLQDNLSGHRAG